MSESESPHDVFSMPPTDEELHVLDELCRVPPEMAVAYLRGLHQNWASDPRLFLVLPFSSKSSVACVLPNNHHSATVAHYYQCSHDNAHKFCFGHDLVLSKCPVCGNTVSVI